MDIIGTVRLKKNDTVNSQQIAVAPLATELDFGELAINYNPLDPCLFFKDKAGKIVKIVDENVIVDTLKDILGGAATELGTLKELLAEFAASDLATVQASMLNRLDQLDIAVANKADTSALNAHIGNKSNPHAVTKAQIGLGNVVNKEQLGKTETAADSSKLGGELPDNVRNFCVNYGANSDGKFDVNTLDNTGGSMSQYTGPSRWLNTPANMSYGTVYQIPTPYTSAGVRTLTPQLAFDINHNVDNSTNSFWFRTSNNLGFQNDWKEVYHSGNSNNLTTDWTCKSLSASNIITTPKTRLVHNEYSGFLQFGDGTQKAGSISARNAEVLDSLTIHSASTTVSGILKATNMLISNNQVYHAGNCNNNTTDWTARNTYTREVISHSVTNAVGNNFDVKASNGNGTDKYGGDTYIWAGAGTGNARGGSIRFRTASAGGTSGTTLNPFAERMVISHNGYVGVGTTTPSEALDVVGNITSNNSFLRSAVSGSSWNNGIGALSVAIRNNASQTPILPAYREGDLANRLMSLELINSGSVMNLYMGANKQVVSFRSDGTTLLAGEPTSKVGVGNANPQEKLDVTGNANIESAIFATRRRFVVALSGENPYIDVLDGTNTRKALIRSYASGGYQAEFLAGGIKVAGDGLFNGNVVAKQDVVAEGDIISKASGATVFTTAAQGGASNLFELGDVDIPNIPDNDFILKYDSTKQKWVAHKVPNHNHDGQIYASDENLKEGIVDMRDAMVMINNMKPKTYHWNKTAEDLNLGHGKAYGLIAQEVELLYPEIVRPIAGTPYKGIDYVKIIPILISAIQEQNETIGKISSMLKTYERRQNKAVSDNFNDNKRITELEKQIEELKQMVYSGFTKSEYLK